MVRAGLQQYLRASVVALAATVCCFVRPASAAEGAAPASKAVPSFEVWTGAEVFQHVWSLYAGGNYAPFGSVQADGFRLRAVGGYAAYSYTSLRWNGVRSQPSEFHGKVSFADLLAGYHKQLGSLTIKILGGLTVTGQNVDDPQSSTGGTDTGAKAVVETWWNITEKAWASVDLSWATLDNVYGTRAALAGGCGPQLSVGVEGGATGNWDYDTARFGGFVRYEWASGELSVSGGVSGDGPSSGWVEVHGPFATVNVLTRF